MSAYVDRRSTPTLVLSVRMPVAATKVMLAVVISLAAVFTDAGPLVLESLQHTQRQLNG